jgi:hypothetical protein
MELTHIFVDFENVQPQDLHLLFGQQYRVKVFHGPHQNKLDVATVKALQPLGEQVEYIQSNRAGKNALDFHIAFWMGRALQMQESVGRGARFVVVSKDGGFDSLLGHVRSLGYAARQVVTIREALAPDGPQGPNLKPISSVASNTEATTGRDLAARARQAARQPVIPVPVAAAMSAERNAQSAVAPPVSKKAVSKKVPASGSGAQPRSTALPKKAAAGHLEKVIEHLRKQVKNRPAKRATLERHILSLLGGKTPTTSVQAVIAELERRGVVEFDERQIKYKLPKLKK